jgi:hypothetical protein
VVDALGVDAGAKRVATVGGDGGRSLPKTLRLHLARTRNMAMKLEVLHILCLMVVWIDLKTSMGR